MTTGRRVFLIFVIFITIAALGGGGYYLFFKSNQPYVPATKAIPESAIMVFETKNAHELFSTGREREVWQNLKKIDVIDHLDRSMKLIDSIITNNNKIRKLIDRRKLFLSLHRVGNQNFNLLFSINISGFSDENQITNLIQTGLGNEYEIIKARFNEINTYKIIHNQSGQVFNYAFTRGVLVCSSSTDLLARSIVHLDHNTSIENSTAYKKVIQTAGNKVNGNLYINYETLASFLLNLAGDDVKQAYIDRFARASSLDLTMKDKRMFLSGFTFPGDSSEKYLVNLRKPSIEQDLTPYLPKNTAYYVNYRFEPAYFFKKRGDFLRANGDLNEYQKKISEIKSVYGSDPIAKLSGLIDGNTLLAGWQAGSGNKLDKMAILGLANRKECRQWINRYAKLVRHDIYRLPSGTLKLLLGAPYGNIDKTYGILTDDILLIAESYTNVKELYNRIEQDQTLNKETYYRDFRKNTLSDATVGFYINLHYAGPLFNQFANASLEKRMSDYLPVFSDYLFSMEFASNRQLYYTNLCVCYTPGREKQNTNSYEWEATLKADIDKGPYAVENHNTGKWQLIVFDKVNQMHLIDHPGNIKWSIPLAGEVLSDVHQVDYYKNGKYQYLFNTSQFIYLIDLKGNKVAEYPLKLTANAANSLSVFHYRDIGSKRILIAGKDNKIHNYYLEGEPVSGWNSPTCDARVSNPVQHLIAGRRDYIIIPQNNNQVKILNRRGANRITLNENFNNALNSPFYENHTNSKGILITTDISGKLTYISRRGNIRSTDFGSFSAGHFFRYHDLDNDNSEDFVYIDRDRLIAFDRFKNVIVEHRFQSPIINAPLFKDNTPYGNILAVLDNQQEYVRLFNKSGVIFPNRAFKANTGMVLESLNNDGKLNLATSYRNKILVYALE